MLRRQKRSKSEKDWFHNIFVASQIYVNKAFIWLFIFNEINTRFIMSDYNTLRYSNFIQTCKTTCFEKKTKGILSFLRLSKKTT